MHPRLDLLQESLRRPFPTDVRSLAALRGLRERTEHRLGESVREVREVEVAEHHAGREERRGRVGDSSPGDVGGD